MTPIALRPRWIAHLAILVLVCQTARLIEGHPRALPNALSDAGNSSEQDTRLLISKLIEEAYQNSELLRPEQWSWQIDQRNKKMQRDASQESRESSQESSQESSPESSQKSSTDETLETEFKKRKLLQVSSTDASIHRTTSVSRHRTTGMSPHRNAGVSWNSDEKIVFPDSRSGSTSVLPTSSCRQSTFCENVADYPRQLVNAALARNVSLRFLTSVDPMPDRDVEQRIDADDDSLCRLREQVIYPQTGQNKEKQQLFIVNQDELKQGIRIEVCVNDGQECNIIRGFSEGYKTTCKQKYIYRELVAVGSNGNIIKDQFRFPSSCCCHVKFTGDPTIRMGLDLDLPTNQTYYR